MGLLQKRSRDDATEAMAEFEVIGIGNYVWILFGYPVKDL